LFDRRPGARRWRGASPAVPSPAGCGKTRRLLKAAC